MDVAVAYNPTAGRGRGAMLARSLGERLKAEGFSVELMDRGPASPLDDILPAVADARALVVVGGDGSVHAMASIARATRTPIYQVPTGTENLFAREFGMDRRAETLIAALRAGRTAMIDLGVCNQRPFLLMCSVGFDANVVHRLARVRNGPIRHASYIRHIAAELWSPAFVPLTISVDGRRIVDHRPGFAVVANSRQYALRLDPALRADMSDQSLDVVFTPFDSRAGLAAWTLGMRMRTHMTRRGLVYERGSRITIEGGPARYQLDGDAPHASAVEPAPMTPIEISVQPAAIRVLLPDRSASRGRDAGSACCGGE